MHGAISVRRIRQNITEPVKIEITELNRAPEDRISFLSNPGLSGGRSDPSASPHERQQSTCPSTGMPTKNNNVAVPVSVDIACRGFGCEHFHGS
jgi:hypothetical protein